MRKIACIQICLIAVLLTCAVRTPAAQEDKASRTAATSYARLVDTTGVALASAHSRLIVSFYSICCGINQKAKEKLDKFIHNYEQATGKQLTKEVVHWGKEGEIDYCFRLSELSLRERKRFVSKVRLLLRRSKLVNINENAACRSERARVTSLDLKPETTKY